MLTLVGSYMVAAIFVPVGLALLPDSTQASFSDGEVGWLVFVIGTAIAALVFWVTRPRER